MNTATVKVTDPKIMLNRADAPTEKRELVVIKKYANRRLYNTETSSYVTLDDLASMVRSDRDFVVYDAKTGDDLTHAVLTNIIVEQESRGDGPSMLPIPFLRQLIRFYDDSMAKMVPGYLQFSLESLAKEQDRFRLEFARAFGNPTAAFDVYQGQVRRNMEMFEKALSLWMAAPSTAMEEFKKGIPAATTETKSAAARPVSATVDQPRHDQPRDEINELKAQLAAMQQRIERIVKD